MSQVDIFCKIETRLKPITSNCLLVKGLDYSVFSNYHVTGLSIFINNDEVSVTFVKLFNEDQISSVIGLLATIVT